MNEQGTLPVVICPTPSCLRAGRTSSLIAIVCARCHRSMLRWPVWLENSAARTFWALVAAASVVAAADLTVTGIDSSPMFLLCFALSMIGAGITLRNHPRQRAAVLVIATTTFALAGAHSYLSTPHVSFNQLYGFWVPTGFVVLYGLDALWLLISDESIRDRVRRLRRRLPPRSADQFLNPQQEPTHGTNAEQAIQEAAPRGKDIAASLAGPGLLGALSTYGLSLASNHFGVGIDRELAQASAILVGASLTLAVFSAIWAGVGEMANGRKSFSPREARLKKLPLVEDMWPDHVMSWSAGLWFRYRRVVVRTSALVVASFVVAYNVTARVAVFVANVVLHLWSFVELAVRAFARRLYSLARESLILAWQSFVHAWRMVLALTLLLTLSAIDTVWTADSFRSYMLGTLANPLAVAGGAAALLGLGVAVVAYLSELPFFEGIPDNLNLVIDVTVPWSVPLFIVIDSALMVVDRQHFRPGLVFGIAVALTVAFVIVVLIQQTRPNPDSRVVPEGEAEDEQAAAERVSPGRAAPVFTSVAPVILLACALLVSRNAVALPNVKLNLPWNSSSAPTIASPAITTVQPTWLSDGDVSFSVTGTGFGTQEPYDGDSAFLEVKDVTGGWNAAYTEPGSDPNTVTAFVSNWADGQITLAVHTSGHTVFVFHAGESVEVLVWNPQTGGGPAVSTIVMPAP
jgi:hypothetical protein